MVKLKECLYFVYTSLTERYCCSLGSLFFIMGSLILVFKKLPHRFDPFNNHIRLETSSANTFTFLLA